MFVRRRLIPLALVTAMSVAAACGSDEDAASDSSPATTSSAPDTAASAGAEGSTPEASFPVTIEHKYGETTVASAPERIVALGVTDQDPLLALGIAPVAVVDWRGSAVHPWNEEQFGDAAPAVLDDPATALDLEGVAAARPDLIIALWSGITEDDYAQLSQIAPTIAQSGDHADWGAPWDLNTRIVGQVTGRVAEAEAVIEEVDAAIDAARAAHPELAGKSVTIAADFADGNLYVTTPDDARYDVLERLGMDIAPAALDGVETLSFEQVDQLNAVDVVFWITLPGSTIATDPVYTAQAVHTEGRDIFPSVESELGLSLTFGTALSIPYTLEHLVPMLAAAVDADPTTTAPIG